MDFQVKTKFKITIFHSKSYDTSIAHHIDKLSHKYYTTIVKTTSDSFLKLLLIRLHDKRIN